MIINHYIPIKYPLVNLSYSTYRIQDNPLYVKHSSKQDKGKPDQS